ncbi:MAG: hypothetical protein U0228_33270 [Myxococcaceae bacterium]
MSHDAMDDRRKALEEQFFQQHDKDLVQKMKEAADKQHTKDELHKLTGINNDALLGALADMQLGGAATLVMSLFPIVEIAWADGSVDAKERKVILELSRTIGVEPGSPAYNYLGKWLETKPELSWHTLWADYVKALSAKMKPDDKAMLKATVLGRARVVAEASGGFMGLLFRISEAEKKVLEKLEQAFA